MASGTFMVKFTAGAKPLVGVRASFMAHHTAIGQTAIAFTAETISA